MYSVLGSQGEKEKYFLSLNNSIHGMLKKTTRLSQKPLTAFLLDHHTGLQHEGSVEATGLADTLEAPLPAE